jgi:uncharacterized membrane protein
MKHVSGNIKEFFQHMLCKKYNKEHIIWILVIFVLILSVLAIITSIIFGANIIHCTYGTQYMMGGYLQYSTVFTMHVFGTISLIPNSVPSLGRK